MNIQIFQRPALPEQADLTRVLMLLPGANEATAEDWAMLQALYSRDPRPIDHSVKLARTDASGEFMRRFYVGYGHDSIAELGQVVVALEGVSMVIAKLIQHYPLYRGQEASTRYVDFSTQPFFYTQPQGQQFQNKLREFYVQALPETIQHQATRWGLDLSTPRQARAARAGAFDVLRGFLPVGATTSLSWSVDLRALNDRINTLSVIATEFPELKTVLAKLDDLFQTHFPHSRRPRAVTQIPPDLAHWNHRDLCDCQPGYGWQELTAWAGQRRASVEWQGWMDFASWRDLARHRSVSQTFPVFTSGRYNHWYLENLPRNLQTLAEKLLSAASEISDCYAQPMCLEVPFLAQGELSAWRYIIQTRAAQTVHPTLRTQILELRSWIQSQGVEIPLSENSSNPNWNPPERRGDQTIIQQDETPNNS